MKLFFTKKRNILSMIILIIILSASLIYKFYYADKVSAGERKLTDSQWSEDIDLLKHTINMDQHALFDSKNKFNENLDNVKENIHNLSDNEITLKLMEATASIGDAHTWLLPNYSSKVYPIYLAWFGDELRVTAVLDKEYENLLGKKLTSINGIGIDKVINNIEPLIPHETDQWLKLRATEYITYPEILEYNGFLKGERFLWTFQDDNGQASDVSLPTLEWDENKLIVLKISAIEKSSLPKPDSNIFTGYWFKYIPDDKILYFQYNTCQDRKTAQIMNSRGFNLNVDSYPDFDDFLEGLYKEIESDNIDKFIIDMRKNGGGFHELLDPLIQKLSDNTNINRKGHLFILIGKRTFSAAMYNCFDLKEKQMQFLWVNLLVEL